MTVHRITAFSTLVGFVLLSACVRVELTSTPDQASLGSDVTYEITVTNPSICPLTPSSVSLLPLMDEAAQQTIETALTDLLPILTLETLCGLSSGDLPEFDPNDPNLPTQIPLETGLSEAPLSFTANDLPANCMGTVFNGVPAITCDVGPLAAGQSQSVQLVVPTTTLGTFLNIASSTKLINGVCGPGGDAGQACINDDDCEGDCEPGICVDGNDAGEGCEDSSTCDVTCVRCRDACSVEGLCTPAGEPATCMTDDDCGEGRQCVCGVPVACTTTQVLALPAEGVPVASTWSLAVLVSCLALLGGWTLWLTRRRTQME